MEKNNDTNDYKALYNAVIKSYYKLFEKSEKLNKEFKQYQKESVKWCWEDVAQQAKYRHIKLTKKAAQAILEHMIYKHDASEGICWITIDCYIDMFKDDPSYFLK
jgi:hypothetical protein